MADEIETISKPTGQDETPIVPGELAQLLGISLQELAALARVGRRQLTAKSATPRGEIALRPICRILAMVTEMMMGDERKAGLWFMHHSIIGFGGDLVRENRADDVVEYLEAVNAGVYA